MLCYCGCGEELDFSKGRKKKLYIKGHNSIKSFTHPIPSLCECGCNEITWNGKRFIHNHHTRGRKHTEDEKNKISNSHKGKPKSPEHIEKIRIANIGRKDSIETRLKKSFSHIGMHHSEETCDKISEALEGLPKTEEHKEHMMGSNNPSWKGGISFLPYCPKFNNELKEMVRNRDNYMCQNPDCSYTQLESLLLCNMKLSVHHIHYDKENCEPDLITLCNKCNCKANFNRDYWEKLYMDILIKRNLLGWKRE